MFADKDKHSLLNIWLLHFKWHFDSGAPLIGNVVSTKGIHMGTKEFHISTAKELLAIKDRVRNLIDHWGEDGRYKEAVLKTIIQRFLPEKYKIGNGFVVKQTQTRGEHNASKQIDLIIYDTAYPILFKESDFVILTPDSVKGIIEVKANLENQRFNNVLKKANENGEFIFQGKSDYNSPFFNGIFSFEGYESLISPDTIKNTIQTVTDEFRTKTNYHKFIVNHISFNKLWFYKYWTQEFSSGELTNYIYKIEDLSFSFFISNLMDYVGGLSVIQNSNLWYPVDKSIEVKSTF